MFRLVSDNLELEALDRGDLAALTLLDLSAAFDTVDHTILTRRLHGDVLWHLLHCSKIVSGVSGTANVVCAVRRLQFRAVNVAVWGSTRICPWTHTVSASLCTVDLTRLIEGHGLHPHLYAEKNADIRGLSSNGDSVSHGAHGHVHQRCRRLDVVQQSTAEHCKNRSTLVRFLSPAAPHPECPLRVCANQESTSATPRYTGWPKKSKPSPIFQKIALKIANEI